MRAAVPIRIRSDCCVIRYHHIVSDHNRLERAVPLPTFETQDMSKKGGRKLRSKSVRSLLTFAHYRFQRFLLWKARQTGAKALLINEAYPSKTCSRSGEIVNKLGGARYITGQDGVTVERDMNGARGALLRALVDTPALEDCVGCLASNVVDVRWRKCIGVRQPGSGATRRICSCTPRSSQFCSRSQAKEAHRGQPSGGPLLSSSPTLFGENMKLRSTNVPKLGPGHSKIDGIKASHPLTSGIVSPASGGNASIQAGHTAPLRGPTV